MRRGACGFGLDCSLFHTRAPVAQCLMKPDSECGIAKASLVIAVAALEEAVPAAFAAHSVHGPGNHAHVPGHLSRGLLRLALVLAHLSHDLARPFLAFVHPTPAASNLLSMQHHLRAVAVAVAAVVAVAVAAVVAVAVAVVVAVVAAVPVLGHTRGVHQLCIPDAGLLARRLDGL